ncbi:hypothetical protein MML48_10g00018619 [Holotrichia oblita]|uniref:Uncharacterized protein n=1 Tax=Holotrichia oblita TaxID=644536 RepID=A0ACB9SHF8_HOLOL|nr:hypothetical protein MML48_10g00018619 [Holotrichia oblita]
MESEHNKDKRYERRKKDVKDISKKSIKRKAELEYMREMGPNKITASTVTDFTNTTANTSNNSIELNKQNYEMAINYEKKYSLTSSESDMIKHAGRGRRRKFNNKNPDYTTDGDSDSSIEPPDMPQTRNSSDSTSFSNKETIHLRQGISGEMLSPSILDNTNSSPLVNITSLEDIPICIETNRSLVTNTLLQSSSEAIANTIPIIHNHEDHLSIITKNIIELKYLYVQMSQKIDVLCQKLDVRTIEIEEDIISSHLPLNTIEALEKFENVIVTNEVAKQQFKYFLVQIGGKDYKNCIRRILAKVFSNNLASACSWTGAKGNYTIKNLCIIPIIQDAVRKNFASVTASAFEETLKEWFRYASQRKSRSEATKTEYDLDEPYENAEGGERRDAVANEIWARHESEVNSDNEDNFQNNLNEHDLDDLLNRFNAVNLNIEINNAMARPELTKNHIDIIPKYEGDPNTLSMYIGACEYFI